jgi:8-oxo-dGTP pyrophosphatase MutT (NUDIX family)
MAAAARELKEETNLGPSEVTFAQTPFTSTDAIYTDNAERTRFHYVISQTLAFATPESEALAVPGDDASEVAWVSLEEMKSMQPPGVVPSMSQVVSQAERLVVAGLRLDKA